MKWIYGKQDWKILERGLENCYLMTNGLGGFSSMTMTGSAARNDHAVLMACTQAPNHRYNLIHRLKEELVWEDGENCMLSTQEFADKEPEEGFLALSSFTWEDTPVWRFHADGMELIKEAGLQQGANRIALRYECRNRGKRDCRLWVTPWFQFASKGQDMGEEVQIQMHFVGEDEGPFHFMPFRKTFSGTVHASGAPAGCPDLYFRTNGEVEALPLMKETCFYRYDVCDGRRESGRIQADHRIGLLVKAKESCVLEIVYETEPSRIPAAEILDGVKAYRRGLAKRAGYQDQMGEALALSAAQFISRRDSTGGDTILAGYPFFEDWGRDTMIALPGICLCTGNMEAAKRILNTFAQYEKDGLMPNLFPEGGKEPMYNTADAALLFVNCVYLYHKATGDDAFIQQMLPVMERIMNGYCRGTHYGIHMAEDGLICAGQDLDQVTWMDVRVGEILPTPRHGKPVEINAYWYNALRIMEYFGKAEYGELAERVKEAFNRQFWMEKEGYLKDVLSGTKADKQLRCNQIWAVSLPFTMLDRDKEKRIVETVFEKLYTPYGLRTLEKGDEEFHPCYAGPMEERDMAYHQGTVWVFPLGAYYLAYLKVNDNSPEARARVREQLEALEPALREGCIGQLPEIYDGLNPVSSKGCFAQAWSVGELLRVFYELEERTDASALRHRGE